MKDTDSVSPSLDGGASGPGDSEASQSLRNHLRFLQPKSNQFEWKEAISAPIFSWPIFDHVRNSSTGGSELFTQYGLLAGVTDALENSADLTGPLSLGAGSDPRLFFNVAAPSSTFICGSQGSGKSHTLSCLLENCLIPSSIGKLSNPLNGLVFHYDTFISDHGGSPCEAAYLSSNPDINVRVLCSPTNIRTIKRTYSAMNIPVEPLQIDEADLNTKRMLDLMAVSTDEGSMPLYLHTISRILREIRISQQESGTTFSYNDFKRRLEIETLSPAQLAPLKQRLDTLESFMPQQQTTRPMKRRTKFGPDRNGTDWTPLAGNLTIVDLSCPCITPASACSLFNICLSIFLEQDTRIGRVVALDEAHKYMDNSAEAGTLTDTLLSTVRLQRHLGARVIVSTQEPTISTALLDLSSITIVHRFTSPDWLRILKAHLAPVALDLAEQRIHDDGAPAEMASRKSLTIRKGGSKVIFEDIVRLEVGEALLFAPSAMIGLMCAPDDGQHIQRLGFGYLKVRIRSRLTEDGGKSVMAL